MIRPCSVILLLAASTAGVALADNIYKGFDEEGIVVYSDRPLAGYWEETLELDTRRTNPAQIDSDRKADEEMQAAVAIREGHEAEEAAEQATRQAQLADQRSSNCEAARARAEKYNTHRKLYKQNADGEREYLSDEELDAARVEAARTADEWCS